MSIFKSIFCSIVTYRSESWVLTTKTKNKLQAMKMKYFTRVEGVKRRDSISNEK
ncbi:hypothetical protein HHI36_017356, partial [Cryptolaemus montrouzieri]